jgi:histidine ammonia-lyase
LALMGEGQVRDGSGALVDAADALAAAGLTPVELAAKEGLALINGTDGMLGMLVLAIHDLRRLLRTADIAAAMSVEAQLGTDRVFAPELQAIRPHPGQALSAANLTAILADSGVVASHRGPDCNRVQDAYSLRCSPQVHGAARDTAAHVAAVCAIEANSISDNPIVLLGDEPEVRSGGNFHGMPVAVAMDALALSLVPVGSISDRRLYRLLDSKTSNGLPPFLVPQSGLNSGFMLIQYTAASLVSECKSLAHPASVDSIPSSAGQEDHVSMGMTSARHARGVVDNVELVVALEALAAAQALDLRAPLHAGPATRAVHDAIRERVLFVEHDREFGADIESAVSLVRHGRLLDAASSVVGTLA